MFFTCSGVSPDSLLTSHESCPPRLRLLYIIDTLRFVPMFASLSASGSPSPQIEPTKTSCQSAYGNPSYSYGLGISRSFTGPASRMVRPFG